MQIVPLGSTYTQCCIICNRLEVLHMALAVWTSELSSCPPTAAQ